MSSILCWVFLRSRVANLRCSSRSASSKTLLRLSSITATKFLIRQKEYPSHRSPSVRFFFYFLHSLFDALLLSLWYYFLSSSYLLLFRGFYWSSMHLRLFSYQLSHWTTLAGPLRVFQKPIQESLYNNPLRAVGI
jgi:hypothetical protein